MHTLQTLAVHNSVPEIQRRGAYMLWQVATMAEAVPVLMEAGVIEAAVAALKNHMYNGAVVQAAVSVLCLMVLTGEVGHTRALWDTLKTVRPAPFLHIAGVLPCVRTDPPARVHRIQSRLFPPPPP